MYPMIRLGQDFQDYVMDLSWQSKFDRSHVEPCQVVN